MTRLVELSESYLGVGIDLAIRSLIVLAFAALVTRLLHKSSAAARHLVWATALVALLVMPAANALVAVQVPIIAINSAASSYTAAIQDNASDRQDISMMVASAKPEVEADTAATPVQLDAQIPSRAETPPLEAPSISWAAILLTAWVVGASILSIPLLVSMLSLFRLHRSSQPLPVHIAEELHNLATRIRHRSVIGLMSQSRRMPMTWGVLRPVVLLPAECTAWSPERRRLVLLHELAHIARFDCLIQIVGQLARALYWFNPISWWALSQLRLEQEQACDDAVLRAGIHADDYAAELLSVTAGIPETTWDSAVALAMARRHRLERRLTAILDSGRSHHSLSLRNVSIIVGLVGALFTSVSIVQPHPVNADGPTSLPNLNPNLVIVAPALQQALIADAQAPVTTQPTGKAEEPKADTPQEPAKINAPAPGGSANLSAVLRQIESRSAVPINASALNEAAIRGMLDSLKDPYSSFITMEQMKQFHQMLDGRLVGIGAALKMTDKTVAVHLVIPNSPAIKGGLKPGDEILAVDGTAPKNLEEAVKSIRGTAGTEVSVKIRREANQELTLTFKRDEIRVSPVKGVTLNDQGEWQHWLHADQKLAYVQITEFNGQTVAELKSTLKKLSDEGLKGLILDLRGNPGGLLNGAIETAQLFLKDAVVVQVKGRSPEQGAPLRTGPDVAYPDVPLVLLVDAHTASASEVLSAALKDHGRAIIVGERSFGKGSVQSIIPLETNGPALKLTTAQMLSPNGHAWNRQPDSKTWGIDPDDGYFIPLTPEQRAARESKFPARESGTLKVSQPLTPELVEQELGDPALAAGLKTLTAKVATGEFVKVGRPLAELETQLTKLDDLRKQRDELRRKVEQLDKQLGDSK